MPSYRAKFSFLCILASTCCVTFWASHQLHSDHSQSVNIRKSNVLTEQSVNVRRSNVLTNTPQTNIAVSQTSIAASDTHTNVESASTCGLQQDPAASKQLSGSNISRCRNELSEFEVALDRASLCKDAAWHALATHAFCSTMHRLKSQFDELHMGSSSDFLFAIDVSPLRADSERAFSGNGLRYLQIQNPCYRTLASLSDSMSHNLERNKCSLCASNNRVLAYCYYLIFRALSVTMSVARPANEQYQFSLPISRVKEVDASTWVTGEYPKRVVQSLASRDLNSYEFFNFDALKHVLADCNSDSIVVNVGANDGFYTLASSVRGCKTISFEPQIGCLQNLYFSAMFPTMANPPLIYNAFLSDANFSVDSGTSCDGGAQFTTKGARSSNRDYTPDQEPWVHPGSEKFPVKSMQLGEVLQNDIKLLLIDVEGAEVSVLNACETLLETRSVHHAIIEWVVGRWSRFGIDVAAGSLRAVAIAKKARWECRLLDNTGVAALPSSSFSRGDDLAALFSMNTNGTIASQTFHQLFFF